MCLIVNKTKTKEFSNKKHHPKLYTFFKYFYFDKNSIFSLYQLHKIKLNTKTIYENNLFNIKTCPINKEILIEDGCFHALTSKEKLSNNQIIEILVKPDHIIAFGQYNDVCFSEYQIPKQSWSKIKNQIKIRYPKQ